MNLKNNKKQSWLDLCKESIKEAGLSKETNEYSAMVGKFVLELCKTF